MNRARRLRGLICFALVAACLAPAGASAETAKFGSALTNPWTNGFGCGIDCTAVQRVQPGVLTVPQVSPANGVITGWAVRAGSMNSRYALRVLRPGNGIAYTGAGTALAPTVIPANGDALYSYAAALPVKKGDAIGIVAVDGSLPMHYNVPGTGYTWLHDTSGPLDGVTDTFTPQGANEEYEVLVQATVTFCRIPDVAGQKLAAAQSLIAAAGCTTTSKTKSLKKNKKNKKKKGKVLSQSPAAGATAAIGDAVTVTIAKLKKK